MQGRSTQLHADRDRHTGPDRRIHAERYKMATFSSPQVSAQAEEDHAKCQSVTLTCHAGAISVLLVFRICLT
jgi:hypothetical protein